MLERDIKEGYNKAHVLIVAQCAFGYTSLDRAVDLTVRFFQAEIDLQEWKRDNWGYPRPLPFTVEGINQTISERQALLKQLAVGNTVQSAELLRKMGARTLRILKDPVNQGIGRSFCNLAASLS